jgi:hypothetical protein
MTPADLEHILALCPREPDGKIRVVTSRALPGKPLGPFHHEGTRADDPSDVFPHEDRRELRALRVFCEWLNHVDSSSHNTLDTYGAPLGRDTSATTSWTGTASSAAPAIPRGSRRRATNT